MRLASRKSAVSKSAKTVAAAAAAVASGIFAQHAKAATLNQYYVNVNVYSDAALSVLVSSVTINEANPVVSMPLNDYVAFGISAVVTGVTNKAAGDKSGKTTGIQHAQPTYLGLGSIGYTFVNSDLKGLTLLPNNSGVRATLGNHQTAYYSTAVISPNNTVMPTQDVGDTEPGTTTAPLTGGDVGMNFQLFAGAGNPGSFVYGSTTGTTILSNFAPTDGSNTASLGASTPVFTNLSYQGIKAGTATITPNVGFLDYWVNATSGTGTNQSTYNIQNFGTADTVVALPVLVVNITGGGPTTPTAHPIISLTTGSANSNYGTTVTNGSGVNQGTFSTGTNKLTVTGGNGSYNVAQVQNIDAEVADTVEANGFNNPATDIEIYGLDVTTTTSGATQLSSSDLAILAADINSNAAYGYGSAIASTSLANDPFPAKYNLFLTFNPGLGADVFLGWDLSQAPGLSATGAAVSAVAVVPEPMSLGLLALGGIGLMARRRKHS